MTLAGTSPSRSTFRAFLVLLVLLGTTYLAWLAVFWPGILGEDSVAILLEVENPAAFQSGKTAFWYYFVRLFYADSRRVELPIAVGLLICAVVFSRILAWYWAQGLRKSFVFALLFICLAPHMIYFMGTLYPEGLFAVASAGLLFELWRVLRQRKADAASLAMIGLTLPFAAFARPNGLVFLAAALAALPFVDKRSRGWLGLVLATWCALAGLGARLHKAEAQGALYPLALFETVNFLRPHAMNDLWNLYPKMNDPWVFDTPKVSQPTIDLLAKRRPMANYQAYADPAYWDMLAFHPDGPQALTLSPDERVTLVHEFFRHNLWHNLPELLGSRTTVFLTAWLAQGGFPAFTYTTTVLPRVHARSEFRKLHYTAAEELLLDAHRASHGLRWLLWTPWLGAALLGWACVRGWRSRDRALLVVAVPMLLQLGAIYAFSTAGEYRYLLCFFTLPLALMAAFTQHRKPTIEAVSDLPTTRSSTC